MDRGGARSRIRIGITMRHGTTGSSSDELHHLRNSKFGWALSRDVVHHLAGGELFK